MSFSSTFPSAASAIGLLADISGQPPSRTFTIGTLADIVGHQPENSDYPPSRRGASEFLRADSGNLVAVRLLPPKYYLGSRDAMLL